MNNFESNSKRIMKCLLPVMLATVVAACGGGGSDSDAASAGVVNAPVVAATTPANAGMNVPVNRELTVTFAEAMDSTTINSTTFTLTAGAAATPVNGTVSYAGTTAIFTPTAPLATSTLHTATLTTGVKNAAGVALASNVVWTFTTGTTAAAGPSPVFLGTAGNYVILAKSTITTTGTTAIVGNIGLSPAAETFITGFALTRDATNEFSTSNLVTGQIHAATMAAPTPSKLTTAVSDMETAYTNAAGRSLPDFVEHGAGDVSGMTLVPGLYKWGTGVLATADFTLSGGANDVWIFQISQDLIVSNGVSVTLTGGALAKNVFWQVAGQTTLGTTADFKGIILSQTQIALQTGAVLNGRALAQTAVTLDANAVTQPVP